MSIACTVCGLWYYTEDRDTLDICPDCVSRNFAGIHPPLDPCAPTAREALSAYVSSARQLTPRQVDAMRAIHARWEAEATRRLAEEED